MSTVGAQMNTVGLILYPAPDVAKTTKFFATLLGAEPYAESPYYTGFRVGDIEIGLVPQGVSEPLAYVDVNDINAALAALIAAGAEKVQDVTDVANGLLVASVKDPNGSPIGLRQKPSA